ncbi:MAG: hypothetical protein LBP51_06385 [Deferribacteraceae bacterium]|jgi:hypothetical protein|nr:hypothetical protein [Deferribacteraceae bacterium]
MRPAAVLFTTFIIFFTPLCTDAYVYVYEAVTRETTFRTASKLQPDAFLIYNGGEDIVLKLTILKIYADKDFNQALEDYGLQSKNLRYMPHETNATADNRTRTPYYWWR